MVDLVDVSGEYNFGAFSSPRDDGLDLMGGQVLGFIDDEKDLHDASAANIGQGGDHDLLLIQKFLHAPAVSVATLAVLVALDHRQVVIQRLHVRVQFGLNIARQKTDILVAQGHRWPGDENLAVITAFFQGGRQGQQGFTGTGLAGDGDQGHLLVGQGIHGKALFGIARADAVTVLGVDAADRPVLG